MLGKRTSLFLDFRIELVSDSNRGDVEFCGGRTKFHVITVAVVNVAGVELQRRTRQPVF